MSGQRTIESMNPYATQLGNRDPRQVIADTPRQVSKVVERLGPEGLQRSREPGKWTVGQILCHLADAELAFGFRLRQALAEPHHVIQPFDQDSWAKPYASLDAEVALEAFIALRKWNLALLETVPRETMSKRVTHPERGEMTFRNLVETMAGHDLNHLPQLNVASADQAV